MFDGQDLHARQKKNHVNFTSYGVLGGFIAQVSYCSCDVLCHMAFVSM